MALALRAKGRTLEPSDVESLWSDPERTSLAELVDAAVKKRSIGIPDEVIWLELGYTPTQIEEMKALQATEVVPAPPSADLTANPTVIPPPVGGSTPPGV